MFRYVLGRDTYIWDPEKEHFLLQTTWNLYAYNRQDRHLLLRNLIQASAKEDGERLKLCEAFISKLALSFGDEAVGLAFLDRTRLGEGPKVDIRYSLRKFVRVSVAESK
jgi:hypothetical protein